MEFNNVYLMLSLSDAVIIFLITNTYEENKNFVKEIKA